MINAMGQDETDSAGTSGESRRVWLRRIVLILLVIGTVALIYVLLQNLLPRWWSHRVGQQVEGRTDSAVLWGGFYGFVFTMIPLLMITQARRNWVQWQGRIFLVGAALLIATPNWLTLAVVTSSTDSAHAARGILDSEAPGFRVATLIGVILSFVAILLLISGRWLLKRRRAQIADLRRRLGRTDSDSSGEGGA